MIATFVDRLAYLSFTASRCRAAQVAAVPPPCPAPRSISSVSFRCFGILCELPVDYVPISFADQLVQRLLGGDFVFSSAAVITAVLKRISPDIGFTFTAVIAIVRQQISLAIASVLRIAMREMRI